MIFNNINKKKEIKIFENKLINIYEKMIKNPTSSEKIKPIYKWIARNLQKILGNDFIVYANGFKNFQNKKEVNIPGKYQNKNVDVAIFSKKLKKFVGIVEVRAPMKSVGKNLVNQLENLLGYTSNVKSDNTVFGHFNIYREYSPIFGKELNNSKSQSTFLNSVEKLTPEKISSFIKLMKEPKSIMHRPDALLLYVANFNNNDKYAKYINKEIYEDQIIINDLLKNVVIKSSKIFIEALHKEGKSNNPISFLEYFALLCLSKTNDLF